MQKVKRILSLFLCLVLLLSMTPYAAADDMTGTVIEEPQQTKRLRKLKSFRRLRRLRQLRSRRQPRNRRQPRSRRRLRSRR